LEDRGKRMVSSRPTWATCRENLCQKHPIKNTLNKYRQSLRARKKVIVLGLGKQQ
jgi:hypothetical protein